MQEKDKVIILGMDVVALYPSIKRDMVAKAVQKAIALSDIEWKNINTTVLVRVVALVVDRKIIKRHNLQEVVPGSSWVAPGRY